jgi:hypothetical protein
LNVFYIAFSKTPTEGAQTTIHCAVDEDIPKHNGYYFRYKDLFIMDFKIKILKNVSLLKVIANLKSHHLMLGATKMLKNFGF